MARIFSFNSGRNGSYLDSISKVAGTLTGGGSFEPTGKGIAWYDDQTGYVSVSEINLSRNSATIEVWARKTDISVNRILMGHSSTVVNRYIKPTALGLLVESDTNGDFWTFYTTGSYPLNEWNHYLVIADSGTVNSYINGLLVNTRTPADDLTLDRVGGGLIDFWKGYIGVIKLSDHPYSAKERAKAMQDFTNASGILECNYPEYQKPSDLSRLQNDGLVAAYNMIPSSGTLVDISGNGNNGTITGAIETVGGMTLQPIDVSAYTNGGYVIADQTNISSYPFSVCFRFRAVSDEGVWSLADNSLGVVFYGVSIVSGKLRIYARNTSYTSSDSNNDYDDGLWHNVVAIFNSNTDKSLIIDGGIETVNLTNDVAWNTDVDKLGIGAIVDATPAYSGLTEISDLKIYNRAFTEVEAIAYHNKFARQVLVKDSFLDNPVGAIHGEYIINSGTFVIAEDVTSKYLSCTGNGTISLPAETSDYAGNGYIEKLTGDLDADEGDTVDAAANVAAANDRLTFTMTAGQIIREIVITKGEAQ